MQFVKGRELVAYIALLRGNNFAIYVSTCGGAYLVV